MERLFFLYWIGRSSKESVSATSLTEALRKLGYGDGADVGLEHHSDGEDTHYWDEEFKQWKKKIDFFINGTAIYLDATHKLVEWSADHNDKLPEWVEQFRLLNVYETLRDKFMRSKFSIASFHEVGLTNIAAFKLESDHGVETIAIRKPLMISLLLRVIDYATADLRSTSFIVEHHLGHFQFEVFVLNTKLVLQVIHVMPGLAPFVNYAYVAETKTEFINQITKAITSLEQDLPLNV